MPLGCLEEIADDRIDCIEVPRRTGRRWRLKFRDREARVRIPEREPGHVRVQRCEFCPRCIMDGGAATQRWVLYNLKRDRGSRDTGNGLPVNRELGRIGLGGRRGTKDEDQRRSERGYSVASAEKNKSRVRCEIHVHTFCIAGW